MSAWRAVLFDLDGTLVDSAPDLAGAVNELLLEQGRPAMAVSDLRPMVGAGARGMLGLAFGITPDHADYEVLKNRFLELYRPSFRNLGSSKVSGNSWMLWRVMARHGAS